LVEIDPGQDLATVADRDDVRRVDDACPAGRDPLIADGGRAERMLERERLDLEPGDRERVPRC
jgi:hypothetical protein